MYLKLIMEESIENQPKPEEVRTTSKKTFFTNRVKLLIGVVIFAIVLLVAFGFIANRSSENLPADDAPEQAVNLTSPEAQAYFYPSTVTAKPGQKVTVDVYIDTWEKDISGANIAIKYNPNVISNVTLEQFKDKDSTVSLAFEEAASSNDQGTGVITLPLNMSKTTPMQKGRGIVAKLSFIPKDSNVTTTSLSFDLSTALINDRKPGKVIVLQKGNLVVNFPIE